MTPQEAQKIKQERQKYESQEDFMHNKEMHRMILETWERDSPQMTERLKKVKAMEDLAVVCQERMWQTNDLYQAAKMPPTDAREQAIKEHLMLEPENQEQIESQDEWQY